MNNFTKCPITDSFGVSEARYDQDLGTVIVGSTTVCRVNSFDLQGMDSSELANGKLIASAFTAGTSIDNLGFDVESVMQNLPSILLQLELGKEILDDGTTRKNIEVLLSIIKK